METAHHKVKLEQGETIKSANTKVTKIPDDTLIITNLGEDTADDHQEEANIVNTLETAHHKVKMEQGAIKSANKKVIPEYINYY